MMQALFNGFATQQRRQKTRRKDPFKAVPDTFPDNCAVPVLRTRHLQDLRGYEAGIQARSPYPVNRIVHGAMRLPGGDSPDDSENTRC